MLHKRQSLQIQEDKWIPTMCGGCYATCVLRVRRVNGVPVAVEGDPTSDWGANGGVCGKAIGILQVLDDPYRVNYPLRRTNPEKGVGVDPKWKRISWDEALNEITERLARIRKENPNKAMFGSSPPPLGWAHWMNAGLFRMAFGSVNSWSSPGISMCGAASHLLSGTNHCSWSTAPDFQYCKYVVYFGSNKGTGAGHSMAQMARQSAEARERGMKIVCFDPLCHQAAARATEWIPILPGTDLAVCLAMGNVLVNELKIYDAEYLKNKTNASYLIKDDGRYVRDEQHEPLIWDLTDNRAKAWHEPIGDAALEGEFEVEGIKCRTVFTVLREHLKQYTPEWASEISTVPASTIRRIATEMAENAMIGSTIEISDVKLPYRPVAIAQFRGGQAHSNGYHTYQAADLLVQLLGACEVPGGQIGWVAKCLGHPKTGLPRFEPIASRDGFISGSSWAIGFSGIWPHHEPAPPVSVVMNEIFPCAAIGMRYQPNNSEWLKKLGIGYEPEFIMTTGGNWIQTAYELTAIEDFLKKPFLVVFDIYNTETTEGFADIVLPDTCWLESYEIGASWFGWVFSHPPGMRRHEFAIRQPVVQPLYERRHNVEVLLELCDRLGIRQRWNELTNGLMKKEGVPPDRFIPLDAKLSEKEWIDRILKAYFGDDLGLEYFEEHGHINWPKRPEEAYWRPFTNGRAMIYSEYLLDQVEKSKALAQPRGIEVDWEQYSPLPTYFPNVVLKAMVKDPSYDLVAFSFKDILHGSSWTHGIPWLAEMSQQSPHHYFALMNTKTAREKGLKDGDLVTIESVYGTKVSGQLHTIEGIHPRTVGFVVGAGGWVKERPASRRLGIHYNNLLWYDLKTVCPITFNAEGSSAVKVYKEIVTEQPK